MDNERELTGPDGMETDAEGTLVPGVDAYVQSREARLAAKDLRHDPTSKAALRILSDADRS